MEFRIIDFYSTLVDEMPGNQPASPSYPEPGQTAPMNPTLAIPGTDVPEVNTGTSVDEDIPAEDIDEDEVGEIESENP